jgi:hypothetical protein
VLTYAASDLNVGATARRHFADVVDLVAALRLRSAAAGVE